MPDLTGKFNRVKLIAGLAVVFLLWAPVASPAEDLDEIIEKVKNNYYDPVLLGLQGLSASVDIPGMKETLRMRPGFEALDFKIRYRWSAQYKEDFQVTDLPPEFDYLSANIERMMIRDGVEIIPHPPSEELKGFKLKLVAEPSGFTIVGDATSAAQEVRSFIVRIDDHWRIAEKKSFGTMEKRFSEYQYTVKDNYNLISREKALVQKPTKQYILIRELEYENVAGFWLVNKLTIRYTDQRERDLAPPKILRFSNFQTSTLQSPDAR